MYGTLNVGHHRETLDDNIECKRMTYQSFWGDSYLVLLMCDARDRENSWFICETGKLRGLDGSLLGFAVPNVTEELY
jgi:hypothetical protein